MAKIYQVNNMGEAQLRVALVSRGEADLLVRRVSSPGLATGDALWYITRDRMDASCWLFFSPVGMAQVKICFVDDISEAGWQKPSRFKGRF